MWSNFYLLEKHAKLSFRLFENDNSCGQEKNVPAIIYSRHNLYMMMQV